MLLLFALPSQKEEIYLNVYRNEDYGQYTSHLDKSHIETEGVVHDLRGLLEPCLKSRQALDIILAINIISFLPFSKMLSSSPSNSMISDFNTI